MHIETSLFADSLDGETAPKQVVLTTETPMQLLIDDKAYLAADIWHGHRLTLRNPTSNPMISLWNASVRRERDQIAIREGYGWLVE